MAVSKRRDGTWQFVHDREPDPVTGRRRQKRRIGFKTRKAAEEAERLSRQEDDEDPLGLLDDEKLTVGEYMEHWLRKKRANLVHPSKPSTLAGYEQMLRIHVRPSIGGVNLRQLRAVHLDRCYNAVVSAGRSITTARRVHALMHVALEMAVRDRILRRNPADEVEAPNPPKARTRTPTVEELLRLLDAADKSTLGPAYRFLALTGLRRGEAMALRWPDVDLEGCTVTIARSIRRIRRSEVLPGMELVEDEATPGKGKTVLAILPPKTRDSDAQIKVPAAAMQILRDHLKKQREEKMRERLDYRDQGVIFATPLGGHRDPDDLTRRWTRLTRRLGLDGIRVHDLRHSVATRMLEAGVEMKVVQEILRHSSYQTTANIYSHVSQDLQADAAARLGLILGNGDNSVTPEPDSAPRSV